MAIVINGSGTLSGLAVGGLPDGTVDAGTLATDSVSLTEMASGTDGNIISYDASGNPVAIATGSDGQVLTSTGAGSPPAFETLATGKVLQVVNAVKSGAVRITSTTYADSGLTASITPASGSKVLVFVNQLGCNTEAGTVGAMTLNLMRASTQLSVIGGGIGWNDRNTWSQTNVSFTYLDSPSGNGSTAFTYKTQAKLNNASFDGYLQNAHSDSTVSSITLMEIGA